MKIKRKSLERMKKWGITALFFGAAVSIWYGYSQSDIFTIRTYSFSGLTDEQARDATSALTEGVNTSTFFFIPNNKVLSYSSSNITNILVGIVPDMESVDIRPVGLHTVKLEVTIFEPLLRIDDATALTKDGILFKTNKDISRLPLISIASSTIIAEKSGDRIVRRIENVDREFLRESKAFEEKVSSVIFKVDAITLDAEGDIAFIDKNGMSKVLVRKGAKMNKVWSTLLSAIDTEPLKSKLKSEKETLEYLDVRFGNKVFYKFKDNRAVEAPPSPAILENYATSTEASTTPR